MGQVGGFKDTAEFFEARSKDARDDPTRNRFAENATFYRSLSTVVPTFPTRYRVPQGNGNRYMKWAEECRTMAEGFQDPDCRRRLFDLAATYERLANNQAQIAG